MVTEDEKYNFALFRECLSGPIVERLAVKPLRAKKKSVKGRGLLDILEAPERKQEENDNDVEDLADFIDVNAKAL